MDYRWKIIVRVIVWLGFINLFDSVTRSNIANAKDDLLSTLHLSNSEYNLIVSSFYLAYVICQVPAAGILGNVPPSRRFGILLILVGVLGCAPAFVTKFWQLILARVLMGIVQAGCFPGICYFLTLWVEEESRSAAMSYVGIAASVSTISSGFIAYAVLQINSYMGLEGWRWLFLVEGVPSIICGVFFWVFFPDSVETASWLTSEEKDKVREIMINNNKKAETNNIEKSFFATILIIIKIAKNWKLWALGLSVLANAASYTFYLYYAPSIISSLGIPFYESNLITVPLQISNCLMGIIYSKISERLARGNWPASAIVCTSLTVASICILGVSINLHWTTITWISLVCFSTIQGVYFNPMYTWITMESNEMGNLSSFGIAFVMSLGNTGALIGPQMSLAKLVGSGSGYGMALIIAGIIQGLGAILMIILSLLRNKHYVAKRNTAISVTTQSVNISESDETTSLLKILHVCHISFEGLVLSCLLLVMSNFVVSVPLHHQSRQAKWANVGCHL